MAGRLAVDFGTSNTVVAVWDEATQSGRAVLLPEYGRLVAQGDEEVAVVPSLIHYAGGGQQWIGDQVARRGLARSALTFQWMKRYVANRSPFTKAVHGRNVSHFEAGRDFLAAVLLFAARDLDVEAEELVLTVPVEAFEHYEEWLTEVATAAGMPRFRVIDEPSAAALGYGASIQPNDVYLIFDFGGGTLDVSVVLIDEDEERSGRRCRVLGKAGADVGGASIDAWLFQWVLEENRRQSADEDVRRVSAALLADCRAAKERLSFHERADIGVVDPETGATLGAEITRGRFEDLLDEHDAFASVDRTLRRALAAARERGYDVDAVKSVLMVGGSSLIPSVQRTVKRIFGRDRVTLHRPLDAVARGAAAFAAGVDFYDHIQHDYAIRFTNTALGEHDYRPIVPRGTPYPSSEPVARLTVKAVFHGQTELGIDIFEIGERRRRGPGGSGRVELVFDPSGAARMVDVTPAEAERRTRFWMNEGKRTFLTPTPPVARGEPQFRVEFGIDRNKRLLLTARNVKTGELTHRDYPVVRLT